MRQVGRRELANAADAELGQERVDSRVRLAAQGVGDAPELGRWARARRWGRLVFAADDACQVVRLGARRCGGEVFVDRASGRMV